MSKTWYGHHIETIKGEDYVLFKNYLELDKEIDKLTAESTEWESKYYQLQNIIDELEKWLNDRSEFTNIGEVLDKLNELRGDNK